MKKKISILLCLCLALTLPVSAAESNLHDTCENSITSTYNHATCFSNIKMSEEGHYAICIEVGDKTIYQPAKRFDIQVSDRNSVNLVVNNEDIPEEIRSEIEERYQKAISQNNYELEMVLFTAASAAVPYEASEESAISESAISESEYYTYNGRNMRSDRLYTYNMSTGTAYIDKGHATKETAEALFNLNLCIASMLPMPKISLVASGVSLLTAYRNLGYSQYIVGDNEDYIWIRIIYDDVLQWTYGEMSPDEWLLGLETQKVSIRDILSEEYYFNSSLRRGQAAQFQQSNIKDFELETENFSSPWEKAYYGVFAPTIETVWAKVGYKTIDF